MTIPVIKVGGEFENSMLYKLENSLTPLSSYLIMPIFALANAGVLIKFGSYLTDLATLPSLGIMLGLFIGKQIGIFGTSCLMIYFKIAKLPSKVTLRHIYGASLLGGIGFTMSIFISSLSFSGEALSIAKISIISVSLLSAILGFIVFKTIKLKPYLK
ncbi:MAG TPA: Na+/H+ antiporter NhaA, partial [Clostridia bacterium]|nr:Na+/H+ antiporter NhaA [Clostridia bacterium]